MSRVADEANIACRPGKSRRDVRQLDFRECGRGSCTDQVARGAAIVFDDFEQFRMGSTGRGRAASIPLLTRNQ